MKARARFVPAASLLAALVAVSPAPAGETNYTTPIGFVNLPIAGTGGTNLTQLNFIGLPLTQGSIEGTMEAFAGSTITDSNASWAINQFSGTNGAHYIEICSGSQPGTMEEIISNDTNTVTLAVNLSGILTNGTSFKIRKHWTLGSVFGVSNSFGLVGGSGAAQADQIQLFDPTKPGFLSFFYKTNSVPGGIGWRNTTNLFVDQANFVILPEQGILLKRRAFQGTNIQIVGEVKEGTSIFPIFQGLNIMCHPYAVTNFTLAASGLYTGDQTTGLKGGSGAANADLVQLWNGTSYTSYFYKTNSIPGGIGWRATTNLFVDAGNAVVPIGSGFFVKRAVGGVDWVMPDPVP